MPGTRSRRSAPANGGSGNQQKPPRRIPSQEVAIMRRQMDGAERRTIRLETEIKELRASIRTKSRDEYDAEGNFVRQVNLSPAHVDGLRLKRSDLQNELEVAKGDFSQARRKYKAAVRHNTEVSRNAGAIVRRENSIRRKSRALLRKTIEYLAAHGQNGGAAKVRHLKALALDGNIRNFQASFDEILNGLNTQHFLTISGVRDVKREIVHDVMDLLAEEARSHERSRQGSRRASRRR